MITETHYNFLKATFLNLIKELKDLGVSSDKAAEVAESFIEATLVFGPDHD